MIDKIRKNLVRKYTIIIALILIAVFSAESFLNLRIVYAALDEALFDYLDEEAREASEIMTAGNYEEEPFHYISSNANVLLSVWYNNQKPVHAEIPADPFLSAELLDNIQRLNLRDDKIYKLQIDGKWHFRLASRDLRQNGDSVGKIVVISNTTKLHHNLKHFFWIFTIIIFGLILLSFIMSNYLASKAIKQINLMFERQKQFVSDASHELRTPLSIMLAYTELLEHKKYHPDILQKLKEEICSMTNLTSKLLQFARFDNQQSSLEQEKFNLTEMLVVVTENFLPLAENKQIRIKLNAPKEVVVFADKGLLKQLIYILLDNAIKYSPSRKVVTIKLKKQENQLELSVIDCGIGIGAEEQKHIFDRFYRADKARGGDNEGLGLGLSLAKMIVQLHHGTIKVQSASGSGSTFTVTLPA